MIEVKNEEFDHYLQDYHKKESCIYRHSVLDQEKAEIELQNQLKLQQSDVVQQLDDSYE